MDAFLGSAKRYFAYMFNEVFDKEIPTVLSKIFGLYRVGYYNNMTGKSVKLDILVMENLFYETSVKNVFDLKGSMRNRWADKSGKEIEVLLDENLVECKLQNIACLDAFFDIYATFSDQQKSTSHARRHKDQPVRFPF
jgi:hypothetical protein